MVRRQPSHYIRPEFSGEFPKLVGFGLADRARGVVLGGISLGPAGIEIVGIVLALVP